MSEHKLFKNWCSAIQDKSEIWGSCKHGHSMNVGCQGNGTPNCINDAKEFDDEKKIVLYKNWNGS